jgi:hypothetical protein
MSEHCFDCDVDTMPCTERSGRCEWYMVHNEVWERAGMKRGFLCIGCLEKRIGRRLRSADFTDAPVNNSHPWNTARLRDRLSSS